MTKPLLPDVAAGRAEAVQECIRRYSGVVWGLARRYCWTEEDAEDLVQEIFLDLWRSASRYRDELGSEITFVVTVARRRLIDYGRKRGRSPKTQSIDDSVSVLPTADEDTTRRAEVQDETDRTTAALAQLRPEQRQVLELALVHGQTHVEISNKTGMPLGTVKSHARRGLHRVREILGIHDDPEETQ